MHTKTYILLAICVAFWSGNFVLGRFIRFELDPIELAFFRWFGVFLIFLPQIIKNYRQIVGVLKKHFLYLTLTSFLGVACFNTFLYIGLQDTTATNALLINSCVPILIIVFSYFILGDKLSNLQIFGVLVSMLGVVFLVLKGDISNLVRLQFNQGDVWIIASSLVWGLYSVLVKLKPKEVVLFLPITVIFGTLMLGVVFFAKGFEMRGFFALGIEAKLTIFYTIIFASFVSFYLWNEGIAKIGAQKTGQFVHLMPVFGILLAFGFLGERFYAYEIFGILLIGSGIYLSLFYAQAHSKEEGNH